VEKKRGEFVKRGIGKLITLDLVIWGCLKNVGAENDALNIEFEEHTIQYQK